MQPNPAAPSALEPGSFRWLDPLGLLGRRVLAGVADAGRATLFLAQTIRRLPWSLRRGGALLESVHFIGNRSLAVIALTACFTGLVLALQGYNALERFGAEQMIGPLVALSLTRELGPVLGALMVTARAGSAIAAMLGNMRVTEQIDAIRTMAIDPIDYLVAPRLASVLIAMPLLVALFNVLGLVAALEFSHRVLGLERALFLSTVRDSLEWSDIAAGLYKSLAFGILMVWISTFRGFHASGGAKGVGQATTRAVVEVSVLVLALDYVLTALLF